MRTLFCLAAAALCACTDPKSFSLRGADGAAQVDVALEPFAFTVRDAAGRAVLRSLSGGASDSPYGGFATTLDRPTYVDQLVPGWDGYRAGEGAWVRGGAPVRLVSRSATRAQLEWDVEGGVVHVALSVDVERVRVTSVRAPSSSVAFEELRLDAYGPSARRIRWDVLRLP